ncbi:hypothetical protein CVT24_002870 [Panaeolus cyanescens]|uniref:RRM domain-containing protein n=1 Tax=Panaeolus cyanescens TaxID=181874 RepID=A0A409YRK9_9AGAR|nr:hypothetical protein CVT24_002870 [Panaeolus cyanescens]
MSSSSNQPCPTLYINNINDKINKEELKIQLYALFTTYGKIIDIIASKSPKMRGQAFLVFTDLASATTAMRACEGMRSSGLIFLPIQSLQHIAYAKSKSYATLRTEDPNFVPPNAANASSVIQNGKRARDGDLDEAERKTKREKSDESSDEEMEIDDDEDAPEKKQSSAAPTTVPTQVQQPSARLLCTNLPQEVTDEVLSVLFQQYQGFIRTHVTWSPQLNAQGIRVKMSQVFFENPERATTAKEALDGFTLKKGWQMSVVYI